MTVQANENEVSWAQKYRPTKIADTILPDSYKKMFQGFVDKGDIPNLLLSGTPGVGKTTVAMAMLEEIGCDYIVINGSLDNGIDSMRMKITKFAGTVSFTGKRKFVIIDEADYLTDQAQAAFRNLIEKFSSNCGFILTCNNKSKFMPAIRDSRFNTIDFLFSKDDIPDLQMKFFKRVCSILDIEGIEYDKKSVAVLINKKFPDFRSILLSLEAYSVVGKIDEGILVNTSKDALEVLFGLLKDRKFSEFRKWTGEHATQVSNPDVFTDMFNMMNGKVKFETQPSFIVIMARYMEQHTRVADPEINFVAFLTELMVECQFE